MELTFITMHAVTANARLLYASDSITDVLGYEPEEVVGKSTFDYFHPDEVPLARNEHQNAVDLDRASVLAYVRVRNKAGEWIGCECVFSIVYDVIVAATTVYHRDSHRRAARALAAPIVRQAFSPDVGDPRYEMLVYLSHRFTSIASNRKKEPRAALILNRFTKNLTILYATHALEELVGMRPDSAVGVSLLSCVQAECLDGVLHAIDLAKTNDSVAYMRFAWKGPNARGSTSSPEESPERLLTEYHSPGDSEAGEFRQHNNGSSNGNGNGTGTGIVDRGRASETSSDFEEDHAEDVIDVEAVITCTSDGILLVLRRSASTLPPRPPQGLFAVPWATVPLYPAPPRPANMEYETDGVPAENIAAGSSENQHVLNVIKEVAVLVWGLQINEEMVSRLARGTPVGEEAKPEERLLEERRINRRDARARVYGSQEAEGRRSGSPGRTGGHRRAPGSQPQADVPA
jgi:PAS domain S-box-containing protein